MRRVKVECGKSPGAKAQESQTLMMHLQNQMGLIQAGKAGILADDNTVYRTSMRILELNGVMDADSYHVNPNSQQAQIAAQQQAEMAQQMQAMQAQMAQLQLQLEQAKIAEDGRQHDTELQFKYDELGAKGDIEEAKIAGKGVIDLEIERMKGEQAKAQRDNAGGADGDRGTLR